MENLIEMFQDISGDLAVAIVIATFYILLAINENVDSKSYRKKFVILCYFLYWMLKEVFEISNVIILGVYCFIILLASLNMAEKTCHLEKNLLRRDLIFFSFIKWLFYNKFYYFILSSFIVSLLYHVGVNEYLSFITLLIGLLCHQISFTRDYFGYESFDHLYELLKKPVYLQKITKEEDENLIHVLAFIVYMEDKDYFERENLNTSLKTIYIRKRNSLFKRMFNQKKIISGTYSFIRKIKSYWRGYSTIEMQVVRNVVLKEDSYQYTIRRKIFIEHFYTKYFYKALKRQLIRYNIDNYNKNSGLVSKQIHNTIKMLFLQYYYYEILDKPVTIEDFILNSKSRLVKDTYKNEYNFYESSYYKSLYEYVVTYNLYLFVEFNYNGGNLMENDSIESWNGKIIRKESDNKLEYIEEDASPHKPSPADTKIAYIKPFEWETQNELYVYDLSERTKRKIKNVTDLYPIEFEWIDDNNIAVILGTNIGTVAVGGNVYQYKLDKEELLKITNFDSNIQIMRMKLLNNNQLYIEGVEYTDDEYLNFEEFSDVIDYIK